MPVLTLNPLNPTALGVNAPARGNLMGFDGTGWRPVKPTYDVTLFGAKGDGTTDDTAAIQLAFDTCIAAGGGTVFFPEPTSSYKVTSTVTIKHQTVGAACYVHVLGSQAGFGTPILWAGGNSTSVFRSLGWKHSSIQNIHVNIGGTATGIVAWDIDGDSNYASTSVLNFNNCHVNVRTGANNIGWRMGHSGGLDVSYLSWKNCVVDSDTVFGASGQTGWVWEHLNCLVFHWDTCAALDLAKGWTGISTAGSGNGQLGGSSMTWTNCGGTANTVDFELPSFGPYTWNGGRFETGKTFLQLGGSSTAAHPFTLNGVTIANYGQGSVEATFNIACPATVVMNNVFAYAHTHTTAYITLSSSAGSGSLIVNGGGVQSNSTTFYTVSAGTWKNYIKGVQKLDGSSLPAAYFPDEDYQPTVRVFNNANISHTTSGAEQAITFNSEAWDTEAMHDTSSNTSRLVAPSAGKYLVGASIRFAANGTGDRYIILKKNGSATRAVSSGLPSGAIFTELSVNTIVDLAATDYMEVYAFQSSTAALNILSSANDTPEFWMTRIA